MSERTSTITLVGTEEPCEHCRCTLLSCPQCAGTVCPECEAKRPGVASDLCPSCLSGEVDEFDLMLDEDDGPELGACGICGAPDGTPCAPFCQTRERSDQVVDHTPMSAEEARFYEMVGEAELLRQQLQEAGSLAALASRSGRPLVELRREVVAAQKVLAAAHALEQANADDSVVQLEVAGRIGPPPHDEEALTARPRATRAPTAGELDVHFDLDMEEADHA